MDEPPLGRVGAVVGGGAHERMTELDPVGVDAQEPQSLDLAQRLVRQAERAERAQHDAGAA